MGTLLNRRRYMGGGEDNSYDAEVQYLETDGASYFDTGVKVSSNITFNIIFDIANPADATGYLFGAKDSGNTRQMCFFAGGSRIWSFGTHAPVLSYAMSIGWNTLKNTESSNQLIVNDYVSNANNSTFTSDNNFYILAANIGGTVNYSGTGTRVVSAKIYNAGVLVRDLIPVRKNGKGFLFDKVNLKLLANKGAGIIGVGPDIPDTNKMVRVEYLESDGTQFIDLGVYPNPDTIAKIKFMNLVTAGSVIFGMYYGENLSYRFFNASNNSYFDTGNGSSNGRLISSAIKIYNNNIYEIELGNKYIKDLTSGVIATGTTYSTTYPRTLTLGCSEPPNGSPRSLTKNRWYNVQIYNGNTLIMDCVPVRIGNIGCMYDSVSNQFLINHGRGDFILGNDI